MTIKPRPLLTILMISLLLIPGIGAGASGEISTSFISSRFILWDLNEKMIDPEITIHIVYFNETSNNTGWYNILIDQIQEEGPLNSYINKSYDLGNSSLIGILKVQVNNITILEGSGIRVISGISGSGITDPDRPGLFYEIPIWEWDRMQWNQFSGVVIGVLLSVLWLGYRLMKVIRRKKGGSVIAQG